MKIIEVLNKIANDEEVPKKIKYQNYIYEYQHRRDTENSFNYMCNENGEYLSRRYFIDNILNDEVEVIEEEPRDIEVCGSFFTKTEYDKLAKSGEDNKKIEKLEFLRNIEYGEEILTVPSDKMIINKINEIIDKLNEVLNDKD